MFLVTLFWLLALASGSHRIKVEDVSTLDWIQGSRAEPFSRVQFIVAFPRPKFHQLETLFWEVSDPDSPKFRQFADDKTISSYVHATREAETEVTQWIQEASQQFHHTSTLRLTPHGDYMVVDTLVATAEFLFDIQLYKYTHLHSNLTLKHSPTPYTLPHRYAHHIRCIHGLTDFLPVVRPTYNNKNVDQPGQKIDPTIIRKLYNVTVEGVQLATQGVAEFEGAQFKQSDLTYFLKYYHLADSTIKVSGPNNGGYFGEASLDVEYITAVGANVSVTWDVAQQQFDLLSWAFAVGNLSHSPLVLSISWGSAEYEYPTSHIISAAAELMKLGLKGHSLFVASGDHGTGKQGFFCSKFAPQWPSTCPYVTAVGGTYLQSDMKTQTGWSDSGGGFSNVFSRPPYQRTAVEGYIHSMTSKLPDQKRWNATGRATPDVSALATNFITYVSGFGSLSGTSAATPTFAGIVSLVVGQYMAHGHTSGIGFVNPSLYRLGNVGYDVTTGDNKQYGCPKGFAATKGWDPITGLGTPDFSRLNGNL